MARLQTYMLLAVCCVFASCYSEPWTRGVVDGYVPVYSTDPALKTVSFQPPRNTVNGGKLFTAGTNVLQEEIDSGLHIISYQDPANPVKTGFLRIPGFEVAAIDGDYLYANNYNDLIAIPLKALSANMSIGRIEGVWKQMDYPTAQDANYFECVDTTKGIVVGWRKTKILEPKCRRSPNGIENPYIPDRNNRINPGLVVSHGKLYLANRESLIACSLSSPGLPVAIQEESIAGIKADSLFLFNNELALQGRGYMGLFNTDNINQHRNYSAPSCQSFIAAGNAAYGISVRRFFCDYDSLLRKFSFPTDTTVVMTGETLNVGNPNAFALSGDHLYIAAEEGLVVVHISDLAPERAGEVRGISYSDIVISNNLLVLLANRAIYCYSIANSPVNPEYISKLPF